MKRVQEKEKYWEERLNINIREEFYIYLYLCEGVTVKKKMLPMEKQFQTYKNWKEHIINILEKSTVRRAGGILALSELQEKSNGIKPCYN